MINVKDGIGYIGDPNKTSSAGQRAQVAVLRLLEHSDLGAAVVIVSYSKPGDSERDVHFAHGCGMNRNAALGMVMLPRALRELADTLERWAKNPTEPP